MPSPTHHVATAVDAEPILALQRRAYKSEARLYDDWTIPPLTQTLESLIAEIAAGTVLKAKIGEAIVGSVRASLVGTVCRVGRLIVEPSLQGRGIGTALLRAIEREFPSAFTFELFTGSKSEGNIRLYRRHGYAVVESRRMSDQVTLVVMRKPAAPRPEAEPQRSA